MKKLVLILLILTSIVVLAFQFQSVEKAVEIAAAVIETPSLVNKDSLTIASRVNIPEGYKRVNYIL